MEAAFSERQDVLTIVTRTEDWLKKAKEQIVAQEPPTAELAKITTQIELHKVMKTGL